MILQTILRRPEAIAYHLTESVSSESTDVVETTTNQNQKMLGKGIATLVAAGQTTGRTADAQTSNGETADDPR